MKLQYFLALFFLQLYRARHVSTPGNGIRIPLTRTPLTLKKLALPATNIESMYYRKSTNESDIHLQYYPRSEYYGPVSVGTPLREFQMIFDTGSSQLWVLSKSCNDSRCKKNSSLDLYDHENSTTYKLPTKPTCTKRIIYGTGEVAGFCSNDTITLDGVELKNTEFLEVVNMTDQFPPGPYEGLFGLSYKCSRPSDNSITQLCRKINRENKFSFYFTRNTSDTDGGELTLCGVDESKFRGPLNYVNETKPLGNWYIPVKKISLQLGDRIEGVSSQAIALVDTGTTHIVGPGEIILAIYKLTNADLKTSSVNCTDIPNFPNVTFAIGEKNYTLEGKDYTFKFENNSATECKMGFGELPGFGNLWIFGDVFFRKYYSVYDIENHRVGFAESIHAPIKTD
ncbi:uncharacterized protein LOC135835693 [Planococcus citri]|uniref:uncharacterized protein LOC135835693 n=1 Tax=Planococcus citri TaxID=170843 RepID=UPI0031F79DBD